MSAQKDLKLDLPIYEKDGQISFSKIQDVMGIGQEDLAEMLDIGASTIRKKEISPKTLMKIRPILKIIHYLWELTEGSPEEMKSWLHEPRKSYLGFSPLEFIQANHENMEKVENKLRGLIYGEVLGR